VLSQHASSLLVLAGVAVAVYLLMRGAGRGRLLAPPEREETPPPKPSFNRLLTGEPACRPAGIDAKLAALQSLADRARQESERLEAAIRRAEELALIPRADSLAVIEDLADPAALADPERLPQAAAGLPRLPHGFGGELFDENRQAVAIANLSSQGLSPAEIARRLGLPIGDVELLLNLRSA
jgi:hypothetical protein